MRAPTPREELGVLLLSIGLTRLLLERWQSGTSAPVTERTLRLIRGGAPL